MSNLESRLEAKRWLEVAEKLLEARDLPGSRRFAKKAQESDPHIDGADQIITIIDVLLASDKRINRIHLDWYAILQLDRHDVDLDQIKRHYKRLALLLHPDKNKFPLAGNAFKLICDASRCLSDSVERSLYDAQTGLSIKSDHPQPAPPRPRPQPKRKPAPTVVVDEESGSSVSTFWTFCPYCFYLYEYPSLYEDCCLRCQNCGRAFHGAVVPSPPPRVGDVNDFYYCTWAVFPIGCVKDNDLVKNSSWTPFASVFSVPSQTGEPSVSGVDDFVDTNRGGIEIDETMV